MRRTLQFLLVASILVSALPAHAGRVVMFFTDSRGNTGARTGDTFPQLVDAARPDFTVCVRYRNGRTTVDGLTEFDAALASCRLTGTVTDAVLLLGINDMIYVKEQTPAGVASNLRLIADKVRAAGVREWILTEPPGPVTWGGVLDARTWTRDNANEVRKLVTRGYRFIETRDEYVLTNWYDAGCSSDALHPTGLPCRQAMARPIIQALP